MERDFKKKSENGVRGAVFVTGASGGIGKICVKRLDEMGFIVFAGIRKREDGESLRRDISKRIVPVLLDITDEASVEAAAASVEQTLRVRRLEGLYGLVNNAGIIVEGPLELVPIRSLRHQFEVNVIGQVAITQALLPFLRCGHGRIVHIGAVTGRTTIPFMGPISASKTAMESIADAWRAELGLWDIPVVLVEPSAMNTEIFNKSSAEAGRAMQQIPQEIKARYLPILAAMRLAMAKQPVSEPDAVVLTVAHALTAKRPKTRYLVGKGAGMVAALRFLPDRLRDCLLLSQFGVSKALAKD